MKFDLVVSGGEVLDPGAGLRGVMDIGIVGGKIAAVAPSLSSSDALRTVSAKGYYVFPGLVDIHAHVLVNGHDMGAHTDSCLRATGVTTLRNVVTANRRLLCQTTIGDGRIWYERSAGE